ncbi:MAG: hypothetical protein QUS07_07210 [Methanothrix sp.]|nr:hypothetical protein [Methanothrix sp.]
MKVDLRIETTSQYLLDEKGEKKITLNLEVSDRVSQERGGRIYIFDDLSDNPVADIMTGYRYNRPQRWYHLWLSTALKALWEKHPDLSKIPLPTEYRWSQYAGCSCPCSPGFICRDLGKINLWITITNLEVDVSSPVTMSTLFNISIPTPEADQ